MLNKSIIFVYKSLTIKRLSIMAWAKSTTTQHNKSTCTMSFGRPSKHSDCERCNELKAGATPVKWNTSSNDSYKNAYCYSVSMIYSQCNIETNPGCNCGKMSYTN